MATSTHTTSRRGILRGLVTLPLIGGSVSLVGDPVAAAVTPDEALLKRYCTWLRHEREALWAERYGWAEVEKAGPAWYDHNQETRRHFAPPPSTRAAIVLSAAGCDWRT